MRRVQHDVVAHLAVQDGVRVTRQLVRGEASEAAGRVHPIGREQLVHSAVGVRVEVAAQHQRQAARQDELLQFLGQHVGLPQLHIVVLRVPRQMRVRDTDAERSGHPLCRSRRGSGRAVSIGRVGW